MKSWTPPRMEIHSLSGHLFQYLTTFMEVFSPNIYSEFSYSNLCLLSLILSLCTSEKSLPLSSGKVVADSNKVSLDPSFLSAEQIQQSQPLLICPVLKLLTSFVVSTGRAPGHPCSSCSGQAQIGHNTAISQMLNTGSIASLVQLAMCWYSQGRGWPPSLQGCSAGSCLACCPQRPYAELLPRQSAPSLQWCMELFHPTCKTLHLVLLNFMRFQLDYFFTLSSKVKDAFSSNMQYTREWKRSLAICFLVIGSLKGSWKHLQELGLDFWHII